MDQQNLIQKAKNGDQEALTELYNQNWSAVLGAIRSIIKDQDEAMDILQDTFIKAFQKIDQFQEGNFTAWIKKIGVNMALTSVKKKKPLLFTDMKAEDRLNDDGAPIEESFVQESTDYQPDVVLDEKETARLIQEILDTLPEEQRIPLMMYYYDEMSQEEICQALGINRALANRRIDLGRKKVEKKVLELEKKGTKLYGLAPIPFLLFLLKDMDAKAAAMQPDPAVLQSVLRNMNDPVNLSGADWNESFSSAVKKMAARAIKRFASASIAIKMIIIGVIAVIGICLIVAIGNGNKTEPQPDEVETTIQETVAPEVGTEEDTIADTDNFNHYNIAMYQYKKLLEEYLDALTENPPSDYVEVNGLYAYLHEPYFAIKDFTEAEDGIPQLVLYGDPDNIEFTIYDYYPWEYDVGFGTHFTMYNPAQKQFWGYANKIYQVTNGEIVLAFRFSTGSANEPVTIEYLDKEDEVISYDEYTEIRSEFSTDNALNTCEWHPLNQETVDEILGGYELTPEELDFISTLEKPELTTW